MPDLKISQLPVASATTGAELFPVVQGGVTKQIALNAVRHIGSAVFDANGSMAVDTNTLFVDAVNNRVGVGTATPTRALDVATSAMVNSSGVLTSGFYDGVGISGYDAIGWYGSSTLAIGGYRSSQWGAVELYTAGVKRVTVDGPGNLNLGVTPSATWASTSRAFQLKSYSALFESVVGKTILSFNVVETASNTFNYLQNEFATMYQQVSGVHSWFTAPSGTAGNAISFTQRLQVDGTTTAGQTALMLWDVDNGTLERVTVGAADSGGTGYKVLRIPN
jgi:hypothetical protein